MYNNSYIYFKIYKYKYAYTNKVFVKYKSNGNVAGFGAYLIQIITGVVDKNMHRQFINVLKKTMKGQPIIIHNEDVDWFHLKGQ